MPASIEYQLECVECNRRFSAREAPDYVCPDCATAQVAGAPLRGVLKCVYDYAAWAARHAPEDALCEPLLPDAPASPLVIGPTPLYSSERLARAAGVRHVWLKDDTGLPTGSLKDRASALVVRMALKTRRDTLTCASTGNAASSLAGLCAAARLPAVIFVSAAAPRGKLVQIAAYGARIVCVDGGYDDCYELSLRATDRFGWYNRNTAYNPWTTEGKKTAAWELACQCMFDVPDFVLVPTGDGCILSGVHKGFYDLVQLGWLDRVPRLVAVQPEGSAAITRAFTQGADGSTASVPDASSLADSLVVDAPRNAVRAIRDLHASNGLCVTVSEDDLRSAIPEVAAATGVFVEPGAAAAWAGLKAARRGGLIGTDARVALLLTGNGLKDVAAAAHAVDVPSPMAPEWNAVEPFLEKYSQENSRRNNQ
jgi:threonine synthase